MLNRRSPLLAEINVTPFVDVMLVLLVIFMITAPLMQHGMDIELPQESTSEIKSVDVPVISLQKNKKVFWNEEEMNNLITLTKKLKGYVQQKKDAAVYFRADKSLDYGFVMKVMTTIRRAGIQSIGMMTEPG